jgi:hypothetical protein
MQASETGHLPTEFWSSFESSEGWIIHEILGPNIMAKAGGTYRKRGMVTDVS